MDMLAKKVKLLLDINEAKAGRDQHTYRLYLALPTSKTAAFDLALHQLNSTVVKYRRLKTFYPHLSLEALPDLFAPALDTSPTDDGSWLSVERISRQISAFVEQFGLALFRVEINKT